MHGCVPAKHCRFPSPRPRPKSPLRTPRRIAGACAGPMMPASSGFAPAITGMFCPNFLHQPRQAVKLLSDPASAQRWRIDHSTARRASPSSFPTRPITSLGRIRNRRRLFVCFSLKKRPSFYMCRYSGYVPQKNFQFGQTYGEITRGLYRSGHAKSSTSLSLPPIKSPRSPSPSRLKKSGYSGKLGAVFYPCFICLLLHCVAVCDP